MFRILLRVLYAIFAMTATLSAATFTVNSAADPGDGTCDTSCTLRDAILAANLNPGADTIAFAIPGTAPFTISAGTPLPSVADNGDVAIDGYTQPGSQPSTSATGSNAILAIEIAGTALAVNATATSGSAVIRGLAVHGSPGAAIVLHSGANSITGCRLGTDITGTLARPNASGIAIYAESSNNQIGGSASADRNIISGNAGTGIDIFPTIALANLQSTSNNIEGNLIGVAADGVTPLGNGGDGIRMLSSNNTITANVISANGANGITVLSLIDPSNPVGTLFSSGNAILGNSIAGNAGQGIDLDDDGPTPNDPLDADNGANHLQNVPVLASLTVNPTATVAGTLDSTPASVFTIQIFDTAAPATLRASFDVTTDPTGHAGFTAALSGSGISAVVGTATNTETRETSEFSAPVAVSGAPADVPALSTMMLIALIVALGAIALLRAA